jgi:hypothetical protein
MEAGKLLDAEQNIVLSALQTLFDASLASAFFEALYRDHTGMSCLFAGDEPVDA